MTSGCGRQRAPSFCGASSRLSRGRLRGLARCSIDWVRQCASVAARTRATPIGADNDW